MNNFEAFISNKSNIVELISGYVKCDDCPIHKYCKDNYETDCPHVVYKWLEEEYTEESWD